MLLFLLYIEPTTPVPVRVASQRRERFSSYNGDHDSTEMAGAPPVGRRARTTRATPANYVRTTLLFGAQSSSRLLIPPVGRRARTTRTTPFKYVRTTLLFGAHSSSRILVPPLGRRARTTRTTPSKYVRRTLLFGAYSSSRLLVASGSPPAVSYGPLRSGTAQAPPIRLVCSALSQHVAQHISASCQYKPQDRPSNYPLFLRFGAEVYARHATDKHT